MAARLLKQTNLNISEIAQKMGIVDLSHLIKFFKKYYGVKPPEINNIN